MSSESRPFGQLTLFLVLIALAAAILFFVMRLVTPLKDRMLPSAGPVPATTTIPVVPPPVQAPSSTPPAVPLEEDPKEEEPSTPPVNPVRPRPAAAQCDAQNFICINAPLAQATITNPTVVTGTAIAFESTFQWRIEAANGKLIAQGTAMADAPDVGRPGAFAIRAFWEAVPQTATGTLIAYEASARDGEPTHVVRVPIRFSVLPAVERSLFFVKENPGPKESCAAVQAARFSLPGAGAPVEATLRALLATDSSEAPIGFRTAIPDRTGLVSLVVTNGLAKVVFDEGLERDGGGSCRVGAIRAQITETLKQFPSIRDVEISVRGKTPAETLQP
mgnify:CR=1 FL=1